MEHGYTLILGLLFAIGSTQGQYDTVFVGTFDTISNGPFETPFPTGGAMTSKTQYLFYGTELTGILANQNIHGIVMDVLDSDPPGTTVDLTIGMKNTTSVCWPTMDPGGWTIPSQSTVHLDSGTMAFMFNVIPFQWNGTWNVAMEFCMERNGPPGIDPRVALDTGFVCDPSYYGHDTIGGPCGALLTTTAHHQGALNSRPVVGFLIHDIGLSAADGDHVPVRLAIYPNPAKDRLRLRVLDAADELSAQVLNTTGALVLDRLTLIPDPAGYVDLALPSLPSGCYLLRVAAGGAAVWEQRFIVE